MRLLARFHMQGPAVFDVTASRLQNRF